MMEIYDVVKKLIGPINPVGETNEDNRRFEYLKTTTNLVYKLVFDIDAVASHKDRIAYSINRAGQFADNFLTELGIEE